MLVLINLLGTNAKYITLITSKTNANEFEGWYQREALNSQVFANENRTYMQTNVKKKKIVGDTKIQGKTQGARRS